MAITIPETQIQTNLNYRTLPTDGSKPVYSFYTGSDPEFASKPTNIGETFLPATFTDARSIPDFLTTFHTDTSGFQYALDDSVTPDLLAAIAERKDEIIQKDYYPLVEKLLREKLEGVKKVLIFDHTVRLSTGDKVRDEETGKVPESRTPARAVHVDQTPQAGINRVHRHAPDEAEKLLKGRVRIINVWRPLRGPVQDIPLGFCDYNTVNPNTDLHPTDLILQDRVGEVYTVTHNPQHKWYYLSEQMPHEVALIKCFDTKEGVASFTPHSAFDLLAPKGALPRQSIEIRALIFDYDGEQ